MTNSLPSFDDIAADFAFIDDWDEKYRYLIDLGNQLTPLSEEAHNEQNKVRGCASQVWLEFTHHDNGQIEIVGDSDAAIVKGLVALMVSLHSGKTSTEILAIDAPARLEEIDLKDHITPQRSNGVASMIKKIREVAAQSA